MRIGKAVVGVVGAGVGVAIGVAFAVGLADSPNVDAAIVAEASPSAVPTGLADVYPINALGETYGSLLDAPSPEDGPDLISVISAEGVQGYVKAGDLEQAMSAGVKQPGDAVDANQDSESIPVFANDGVTRVGSYVVTGQTGG